MNIERGRGDLLSWDADRPKNFYDQNLDRTLALRLGRERHQASREHLSKVGELSAVELPKLGLESNLDENLPRLERYSGLGERTESVVFHPSYHEQGRRIWATGVLSGYKERGRETEQLTMLYLFAHNGELGHLCPIACTAGLIKLVQAVGSESQKARWLPGLLSPRYEERLHASQFLTEVQGGSDVGSNAVVARADGAGFRIHGEKWFCSVIDARLFLMTARPEGAPDGTRGLGLFVVPREIDGKTNEFQVRRLKRKLGTRAMASAEVDFVGARAEAVGPLERGFKNVVELVLDTSRVYNAMCCAGAMHRAYLEAAGFAKHRRAFGQPITAFPLVQEALATLRAESMAALASTLRLIERDDRLAHKNDDGLRAAQRLGINANKYWTAVRNTQMARLAMEVLGGNGTIETFSVIPQLYRDAMVLESWEGTHNTLVQQILRDTQRLRLHEPYLADLADSIGRLVLPSTDAPMLEGLRRGFDALSGAMSRMSETDDQRWARRVVDQMAVLQSLVAMAEELAATPSDATKRGAIQLLMERDLRNELPRPSALPPGLVDASS
jgi:alkylation response protein AidB-like acyl-CoA dehydrogenase